MLGWLWAPELGAAPTLPLTLLNSRSHDVECYTQGLFFYKGQLFESGGLYGRSTFSKWNFGPGRPLEIIQRRKLPDRYFAEGADANGDEIFLLTWRENTCFVIDPDTLMIKRKISYQGEGWGLAWDGERFWRSDGSARLHPHRGGDFAPDGEALTIRDGEAEVGGLNELEWDGKTGLMLANIYGRDEVAVIDLTDGRVRFWLDAAPLRTLAESSGLPQTGNPMDVVLNGLALDDGGLWLTGKFWPRMYQAVWPPEGMEEALTETQSESDQTRPAKP